MEEKRDGKKRYDLYAGIALTLLSIFIFFYSFSLSKFNREGMVPVGPRFFPQLIGIGLFICGLILTIKNKPYQISMPKKGIKDNTKVVLLLIVYILCFEILGYIISTFIFVYASIYFLGYKKIFLTIIFSVGMTVGIYLIFYTFFKIPLPGGLFGHKLF